MTTSIDEFSGADGVKVNYSDSRLSDQEIWIRPHGLLHQTGTQLQDTKCFDTNEYTAFFKTDGDFRFDIFAASFFLLSRYEEYQPHEKDEYGRFPSSDSLAHKEAFLHLPVIDLWIRDLTSIACSKFPSAAFARPSFEFLPTYDIDMAWSFKHKGFWRNLGGMLRSLSKGKIQELRERARVLTGSHVDPFDAFDWLNHLHEHYSLNPYYFFLVARRRASLDKNISPTNEAMQQLIRDHAKKYKVGIHPSWMSGDNESMLKEEISTLSLLINKPIIESRQHYIRFNLPHGYRRLIKAGIKIDFSMGYGDANGFRASTCMPFYWYDLEKEVSTELLLFPFCFMEANAFYENKISADEALAEMRRLHRVVKSVNGHFIMIWHNTFLGTDKLYAGWKEIYEQFIKEAAG
ncbi:MAG: polysaccharide deacetylase family protein [Chitinophagaceae bacterium]|nr:polysaccharide deacetylase family protein [Chitinophagaceae bacterium]